LLLCSELASRYALKSGFLYRAFDLSGIVSSLPELRDRIRWASSRPHPVIVLGDSVLGASALFEHGEKKARRQTVPVFLKQFGSSDGWSVESLGADGFLLPDLEVISRELRRAPPERILVILNVRMFASEFEDPAHAFSRDFLASDVRDASPRAPQKTELNSLDARVSAWFSEKSSLLLTAHLLQPLWYFPTRRDFCRRLVEKVAGGEQDSEIREAALRLKVAPYYGERWNESAPAFRSLAELLAGLKGSQRVVVVLTPQNSAFVKDAETFHRNRGVLRSFVTTRGTGRFEYRDFSDRYSPDQFLDHCHLTAAGNRDYARALAALILS
jgi:hypothetical protein